MFIGGLVAPLTPDFPFGVQAFLASLIQEDDSIVVTQAEGARAAGKHLSAQGIDDVGQRIQMRNGLQPAGHDGGGVNRVAREEQRHGEHLADAHEALARLHNARDDERERREQRRGEDHEDQHRAQVPRVELG